MAKKKEKEKARGKRLEQLGRYKIIDELGRGAMGVVYRAHDPVLDRTVALKTILLSEETAGRNEYAARFFQEAKAAGRLNHPHLLTIYDFGEEGDLAYMAMELLDGTDLRKRMAQGGFPVYHALDIAAQVADGLGYAHEHGVVHRDIKPGNIMLLPRGRVKIMDFGIARVRLSDLKTQTGAKIGTPRYMSPEQATGRPADHRSDIFSVGIVLYEMLTGTTPFEGTDANSLLFNIANAQHVPPSRLNAEVDATVDLVINKTLRQNPEERYEDAYVLAGDLRTCMSEIERRTTVPEGSDATMISLTHAGRDPDGTPTLRLDPSSGRRPAPAAISIGAETHVPLSAQFDSSAALRRLGAAGGRDRRRLARAPRPAGVLRQTAGDGSLRLLVVCALLGAAIAALIALG